MANFIFRDRSKYAVVGKGFFDLVNANPPLNWGDMQQEVKNLIVSNGAATHRSPTPTSCCTRTCPRRPTWPCRPASTTWTT